MSGPQPFRIMLYPTVLPAKTFNVEADVLTLRNAMRGLRTNKKAIINVLCHRNMIQRLEIAESFKAKYGKELIKKLRNVLRGNLSNAVMALMTPLPYLYVRDLRDAAAGIAGDEGTIIEILCTSNYGIRTIIAYYEQIHERRLKFDLKSDTSGKFKRLCAALCKANRDETPGVDEEAAAADAQALVDSEEPWDTAKSIFNNLIINRSYQQLQKIFIKYEEIAGVDIEETITNEFTESIQKGMLALVKCIKNKTGFYAERLHYAMKGLGTSDKILIRIVIGRSEIDLADIKREFFEKYERSLASWIAEDTSGYYKETLLKILE